jgi:hypothetical protein
MIFFISKCFLQNFQKQVFRNNDMDKISWRFFYYVHNGNGDIICDYKYSYLVENGNLDTFFTLSMMVISQGSPWPSGVRHRPYRYATDNPDLNRRRVFLFSQIPLHQII